MNDQELLEALNRFPAGEPVVMYHVDVTGAYVEASRTGRVDLRPGEFWLTTNVEARTEFRGGRGLEGNILAFQLDSRFVQLVQELAMSQRDAAAAEKFLKTAFKAEIAVPRVNFEGGGKGARLPGGDINMAIRVTQAAPQFNRLFQLATLRTDRVKYDGNQPAGARLVPYGLPGAHGVTAAGLPGSGYDPSHAQAALGIIELSNMLYQFGTIVVNKFFAEKELHETVNYLRQQVLADPTMGYLVVASFSKSDTHPDSAMKAGWKFEFVSYYAAPTLNKALSVFKAEPPHALLQQKHRDWMNRWYWMSPKFSVVASTTKGRIQALANALASPADYVEAFHLLNGSSMADLLAMLMDRDQRGDLWLLQRHMSSAQGVNMPRLMLAMKAVNDRNQGVSFDKFIAGSGNWVNSVETDGTAELKKFFGSTASDAIRNALAGVWKAQIGAWSGAFSFDEKGGVFWQELGGGRRHEGTWKLYQGAVEWQFNDDPPGFQRTFVLPFPFNRSGANGQILPSGQGFFSMMRSR